MLFGSYVKNKNSAKTSTDVVAEFLTCVLEKT